jgi:hypothetical protein
MARKCKAKDISNSVDKFLSTIAEWVTEQRRGIDRLVKADIGREN